MEISLFTLRQAPLIWRDKQGDNRCHAELAEA